MLSLKEAQKTGRLDDFIKQEEARGIGVASLQSFEATVADLIKQPQSEGQTLRSPSGDGLHGK